MEPDVQPSPTPGQGAFAWDDDLWDRVWERMLGPVERHGIARSVWRRDEPDDIFEARVGAELARRWRGQALRLAVVYGLWTLFWGLLAIHNLRDHGTFTMLLAPTCAGLGLAAVAACLAARRWMRPVAGWGPPRLP